MIECDLAVIGCGPVGLYAAYCAGFRGLLTVIVDSLPEPGGQVSAIIPRSRSTTSPASRRSRGATSSPDWSSRCNAAVRINPDEHLFPGHSSDAVPA